MSEPNDNSYSQRDKSKNSKGCTIGNLFAVKAFYFLMLGGTGCLIPFVPIFLKQVGLSSMEVGIIYGPLPIVNLFLGPAVGALGDKYQRHKLLLIITSVCQTVFFGLLLTVPNKGVRELCPAIGGRISVYQTGTSTDFRGFINCDNEFVNSSVLCRLTVDGFSDHATNTTDNVCMEALDCFGRGDRRLWGCEITFTQPESIACSEFTYGTENTRITKEDYEQQDMANLTALGCVKQLLIQNSIPGENRFGVTFWMSFVFVISAMASYLQVSTLIDAIAYCILDSDRAKWGNQRMFGSLGFGLFTVFATVIMDLRKGPDNNVDYSIFIYIYIVVIVLSMFPGLAMKVPIQVASSQVLKDAGKLLSNARVVSFLIVCLFFGIYIGAIESFLFWFLTDLEQKTDIHQAIILGMCVALNCAAEMIVFPFSGRIIDRIGHLACLYLVGALYCVRFLAYSLITNPWIAVAIEPLHGITFGLMASSASSYASVIAPAGLEATSQGCYNGMFNGFGRGIGTLITGLLFEAIGDHWTFGAYSVSAAVVVLVFFASQTCLNRSRDPERTPILDQEHPPSYGRNE